MTRMLSFLAVLLLVAGCVGSSPAPGLGQAEVISVIGTKKTITDHVVSYMSGKNCSFRRTNEGLTYCEEDEAFPKPPVYCYETLGRVTCYDQPDPYDPRRQKLGENDHNLAQPK